MSERTTALRRCIGDVTGFERAWGLRPLHFPHSDPAAFADVLGLADVDALVSSSVRTPTIRMVRDGGPLPPSDYCMRTRLGGRHLDDVVDPIKVAAALSEGATLVLQSLHRLHPSVSRFSEELQDDIGHRVQANAYLTPPSSAGLAPHADAHDVIVLQLVGSKHWKIEGLGDVLMHAGDSMYVPAGVTHSAHTSDHYSLHLTLGLIRVTRRDLIWRLLADLDELDDPLPLGYRSQSPDTLRPIAAAALAASIHHLEHADLDEVVAREQSRRLPAAVTRGRISSMVRSRSVTADTVIRWVGPPPRVRPASSGGANVPTDWTPIEDAMSIDPDCRIDVHVGARVLTVPGAALETIAELANARVRRIAELPGLDAASRVVVAQRLLEEAVCVIDDHCEQA